MNSINIISQETKGGIYIKIPETYPYEKEVIDKLAYEVEKYIYSIEVNLDNLSKRETLRLIIWTKILEVLKLFNGKFYEYPTLLFSKLTMNELQKIADSCSIPYLLFGKTLKKYYEMESDSEALDYFLKDLIYWEIVNLIEIK